MTIQNKIEEIIRELDNIDISNNSSEVESLSINNKEFISQHEKLTFIEGFESGLNIVLKLLKDYKINNRID